MAGCRTVVVDKESGEKFFHIDDKYTLTFYYNTSQKGPIYIDNVIAVPRDSFTHDYALRSLPLDVSQQYAEECNEQLYANRPGNVSDYCKRKIFSLTTEFNTAALPCECNPQGSLDFTCAEYGGQCRCKANVIGRQCERCAPVYYNYPECLSKLDLCMRIFQSLIHPNLQSASAAGTNSVTRSRASASVHAMWKGSSVTSACPTPSATTR